MLDGQTADDAACMGRRVLAGEHARHTSVTLDTFYGGRIAWAMDLDQWNNPIQDNRSCSDQLSEEYKMIMRLHPSQHADEGTPQAEMSSYYFATSPSPAEEMLIVARTNKNPGGGLHTAPFLSSSYQMTSPPAASSPSPMICSQQSSAGDHAMPPSTSTSSSQSLLDSSICPHCERQYDRSDRAENCYNKHLDRRPYQCTGKCGNVDCNASYRCAGHLIKHQRPPEWKYIDCTICSQRILRQNKARHMRETHAGSNPK